MVLDVAGIAQRCDCIPLFLQPINLIHSNIFFDLNFDIPVLVEHFIWHHLIAAPSLQCSLTEKYGMPYPTPPAYQHCGSLVYKRACHYVLEQ